MKIFLLTISFAIFIFCLGFIAYDYNKVISHENYWGNEAYNNSFWLSPENKNVSLLTKSEEISGYISQVSTENGVLNIVLTDFNDDTKKYKIPMPDKYVKGNATLFNPSTNSNVVISSDELAKQMSTPLTGIIFEFTTRDLEASEYELINKIFIIDSN